MPEPALGQAQEAPCSFGQSSSTCADRQTDQLAVGDRGGWLKRRLVGRDHQRARKRGQQGVEVGGHMASWSTGDEHRRSGASLGPSLASSRRRTRLRARRSKHRLQRSSTCRRRAAPAPRPSRRRRPPGRAGPRWRPGARRPRPARRRLGPFGSARTFTGTPTASITAAIWSRSDRPWRVHHVRAGVPVGDQPGDRVVEIVDAADVVLAAAGEHHRVGQAMRGLCGHGDLLGGDPDVVDAVGCRVVVLDREARRPGVGEQRHGLGHPPGSSG